MKASLLNLSAVAFVVTAIFVNLNCTKKDNPVEPSNTPPEVAITNLAANASYLLGDTITFTGTAIDAEDGTLGDSSLIWTSSIDGTIGTGASIQTSTLSVNTHLIIFTATDGGGLVGADTATVIIRQPGIPVVVITSPADSSIFRIGDTISFTATATDTEDGILIGSSLVWTSDNDGQIGTGDTLVTDSLSINTHVITLTATDSHGDVGIDHITVAINPKDTWERAFGGVDGDLGLSVGETSDGGIIILGNTASFGAGGYDVYLIKTDRYGDTLWTRTFGGASTEYGYSMIETSSGNFVLACATSSYGAGGYDMYLIKTDNSGNLIWEKTFGGTGYDFGYSIVETLDGGYVIAGTTNSYGAGGYDLYLIKTDINGDSLWTKTFGGTGDDEGYSIVETPGGDFVITGLSDSYSAGDYDVYLIRADSSGNLLWEKTFGGINDDIGETVIVTTDGSFVITGEYGSGIESAYLIKTDSNGNTLWTKTFGGIDVETSASVMETSGGDLVMVGSTYLIGANHYEVYLIKADNSGSLVWEKTLGGTSEDEGYAVCETSDGGIVIVGKTASYGAGNFDVYLIKTDADGNVD